MTTEPDARQFDETPDGEAARGSGAGIIGAGTPISVEETQGGEDLQDDQGRDPTAC